MQQNINCSGIDPQCHNCCLDHRFVISLDLNGHIASQGTALEALVKDSILIKEVTETNNITEKVGEAIDLIEPKKTDKNTTAKLVMAEEIAWVEFTGLSSNYLFSA